MSRLRLGLDLRSGGWLGGLYYLQNLVLALRGLPDAEQPELVGFASTEDILTARELDSLLEVVGFQGGRGRRAELRRLPKRLLDRDPEAGLQGIEQALRRRPVDVLFPSFGVFPRRQAARGPTRLPWVTDLQHLHLPAYFGRLEAWRRTAHFASLARHAGTIVVSSEDARRHFEQRFPRAAGKTRVLHFRTVVTAHWLDGDIEEVCARHGVTPGFLLVPNQFWAHKGHATAFKALNHLGPVAPELVCTGSTEDYRRPTYFADLLAGLERSGQRDRVKILGVVPRADYVQLLRAASVVVQPSHFEGWSSVVEDARALGKRLVLSDLGVHREQRPPGAHLFRSGDEAALAVAIEEALRDPVPDEREAVRNQQARVMKYARTFLSIAREAAARG
jgi:glycosyltransferase involved in cell wall biosynthesis